MNPARELASKALWKAAALLAPEPRHVAQPCWTVVKDGPLREANLYLDVQDSAQKQMLEGHCDSFLYEALQRHGISLAGKVVWDVGAFVGYHTLGFASLVGQDGHVVAFEPNPYNAGRLQLHLDRNAALAARIRLETVALSDREGQQPFRFSRNIEMSSISGLDAGSPPTDWSSRFYDQLETMPVNVTRADALVGGGLRPPALMKIDVEGAEAEVLEGARGILRDYRPVLFIEIHNITCMFRVQKMLFECHYTAELVDDGAGSRSRGYLLSVPTL